MTKRSPLVKEAAAEQVERAKRQIEAGDYEEVDPMTADEQVAQHAPGPWETDLVPLWYPWPESIGIMSADGAAIAWLTSTASERPRDEANARLIAAAPDMLAALEAVKRAADYPDELGDVIDAAIAKARGPCQPMSDYSKDRRVVVLRQLMWDGIIVVPQFDMQTAEGREMAARGILERLDETVHHKTERNLHDTGT